MLVNCFYVTWDIVEMCLTFLLCSICFFPLQARNIAVCIEFKDSDEDEAQPLKVHLYAI